jgi:hypothetical protein
MADSDDTTTVAQPVEGEAASDETSERLRKAEADWKKLQAEISPFVPQRRFREHSTAGAWRETSSTLMRSEKNAGRHRAI